MFLWVAILISVALAVLTVYPLLETGGGGKSTLPIDVTPQMDLKRRRLVLYENLQDLEFEYRAKKIAPDDYQALREAYTTEAARLMAASQELEQGLEDAFIEKEVASRRARRKGNLVEQYKCAKCGFENPVPVKFCGECGTKMGR
jgi:predicted Zn-ribbon and HTH transcriptional regulator